MHETNISLGIKNFQVKKERFIWVSQYHGELINEGGEEGKNEST